MRLERANRARIAFVGQMPLEPPSSMHVVLSECGKLVKASGPSEEIHVPEVRVVQRGVGAVALRDRTHG